MSLGYTYIKATGGKFFRNPVIKSNLGQLYFDDGDPEVLFKLDQKSLAGLSKDARKTKMIEIANAFFDSVGNVVRIKDRFCRVELASEKGLAYADVVMTKRVPANLITEHDGMFDQMTGEGSFPALNG
jgi:hypothetical protein